MTPLPPACAECVTKVQPAAPGAAPRESASRMFRASDGKTRLDSGTTTVITDPAAGKTIILDHVKKEARMAPIPAPPAMAMPQLAPGAMPPPGMPAAAPPGMVVQDLGKRIFEGQEVDGKKYILPPANPPKPPAPPQVPGMPKMPQTPPLPQAQPTTAEVWTNPKLQMPVFTKITGDFGEQICQCRNTPTAEPPASLFQIPPDYKAVEMPPAPKPPGLPRR